MKVIKIGSFINQTGEMIVVDPGKSEIILEPYKEKVEHMGNKYIFNNIYPGTYNCYNQNNEENIIQNVIVLHEYYEIDNYSALELSESIILETGIGRAFCCVDTKYYNSPEYSLNNLSIFANYSPTDLLKILTYSPYSKEINSRIEILIKKRIAENKFVDGLSLSDIIGNEPYWAEFKNSEIRSDHWSGDIHQRLSFNSCTVVIQSGMATRPGHNFLKFHLLKNNSNDIIGFVIDYDEIDIFEIPEDYHAPWNYAKKVVN